MGYGAIGAGGITAFTALFKYVFASMALAPLWTGIAHSVNYTASFVLMQLLGWMLASKMPSMTAAALCAAMDCKPVDLLYAVPVSVSTTPPLPRFRLPGT